MHCPLNFTVLHKADTHLAGLLCYLQGLGRTRGSSSVSRERYAV